MAKLGFCTCEWWNEESCGKPRRYLIWFTVENGTRWRQLDCGHNRERVLRAIQHVRHRNKKFGENLRYRIITERCLDTNPHGPVYWVLRRDVYEYVTSHYKDKVKKHTRFYETEDYEWTEDISKARKFRSAHERELCENFAIGLNEDKRKSRERGIVEQFCARPIFEDE